MGVPWWSRLDAAVTVTGTPVLQVAADGAWESARPGSELPVLAAAAERDVAAEVLWPQGFAGARWSPPDVGGVTAALHRAAGADGLAAALRALVGGDPAPDVERIELGAVDAWASAGPEVLWRPGESAPDLDAVLFRRPDLLTRPEPLAVEFAGSGPRECWIGVIVSRPADGRHRLHRPTLDAVLALRTG